LTLPLTFLPAVHSFSVDLITPCSLSGLGLNVTS
jgi:hypothetical protein